jgi:hypothetical protein
MISFMIKSQLMVKSRTVKSPVKQLKQQIVKKACFGTKEWSGNSGICNRCDDQDECGKVGEKRKG